MPTNSQSTTNPAQPATNTTSPWEKMLMQALMAQKLGSRGTAGMALGQILAALLKNWKSNYEQRGEMRREWEPLTSEERAQRLSEIRQQNPAKADEAEKFVKERWGEDAFGAQPQAQPQISAPISQAGQQIVPNTDLQNQQSQLLGSPPDWERFVKELERRRSGLGGAGYGF